MKNIVPGSSCSYKGNRATVHIVIDFKKVIIREETYG